MKSTLSAEQKAERDRQLKKIAEDIYYDRSEGYAIVSVRKDQEPQATIIVGGNRFEALKALDVARQRLIDGIIVNESHRLNDVPDAIIEEMAEAILKSNFPIGSSESDFLERVAKAEHSLGTTPEGMMIYKRIYAACLKLQKKAA